MSSDNDPESESSDDSTTQTDAVTQASPSSTYKTRGKTAAGPGTGVLGYNTSTTGVAYGVEGVTDSTDAGAAGVRAVDQGGSSSQTFGLLATTDATGTDAAAVEARATAAGNADAMRADASGGDGNGIHAIADSNGWYGVFAENSAGSGSRAYAVNAINFVAEAPAIVANTNGGTGIESEGAIDAETGYRGAVGSAASLSSNWSVSSTLQKIPFDSLIADQRGEFDTSNNWFECAHDGTYVVELGLESASDTTGEIWVDVEVTQGSASSNPAGSQDLIFEFAGNGPVARTLTRTIYGLNAGNRIYVEIADQANNLSLEGGTDDTFLSVRQVGGGGSYTSSPASTSTAGTTDRR